MSEIPEDIRAAVNAAMATPEYDGSTAPRFHALCRMVMAERLSQIATDASIIAGSWSDTNVSFEDCAMLSRRVKNQEGKA